MGSARGQGQGVKADSIDVDCQGGSSNASHQAAREPGLADKNDFDGDNSGPPSPSPSKAGKDSPRVDREEDRQAQGGGVADEADD